MISKITIVIVIFVMSFIAYNKSNKSTNTKTLSQQESSSVSLANGKYVIDSTVIRSDRNKSALFTSVQTESLAVKSTITEVPDFIWSFLKSIAYGGKFDIVNPGEEWKCGIVDFGHTVVTKTYDKNSKDTVWVISGDGQVLPNKQLAYFGIGKSVALLSYYGSGFNTTVQNVVMIKFQDKKILDFWYRGFSYNNPSSKEEVARITTKSEIIKTLKLKPTNGC